MNKAVPWNVNGVGFDAREAARDAARRQGKSLGEWLHGVIADHAVGLGVEETKLAEQQKIDAVTSKLERLSARSQEHDRHVRPDTAAADPRRTKEASRLRVVEDDDEDEAPRPRRRRRETTDAAEFVLEEAIDAMERRAQRAERRTDKALQSMAELLQRTESHRDRERESVSTLARKLSDIETRLGDRLTHSDDNPVKSALARLEARLDTIGRRSAAEALARQQSAEAARRSADARPADTATKEPEARTEMSGTDPLHRLEEKLNTILDAVHIRPPQPAPQASSIAMAASQAANGRGRLGDAIAEIATRQHSLDDDASTVSLRDAILRRRGAAGVPRQREPAAAAPIPASYAAMQDEIAKLASTIETLRRDVVGQRQAMPQPVTDFDALRSEIAAMAESLRELASRGRSAGLAAQPRQDSRDRIDGLQRDLAAIDGKIDELQRPGIESAAVARIQDQMEEIRDLITASVAKPLAVERIEHRIADLSERIDLRAPISRGPGADASNQDALNKDALGKIESKLEGLAAKIDTAIRQGARRDAAHDHGGAGTGPGGTDVAALERLVRDLTGKMEVVQSPGAGSEAYEALQSQIAVLSAQFERSDGSLSTLASLERSMRDLFVHLEETRASVETSAQRAAREVLRIAVEDGRENTDKGTATSLATMQALQDEADARTNATLSAVHETLEKVVDRLSSMERDIADVRSRPVTGTVRPNAPQPHSNAKQSGAAQPDTPRLAQREPKSLSLGAADPMLESMLGHRPGAESPATPRGAAPRSAAPRSAIPHGLGPVDLDDEQRRAGFIAAARRAAKAAQSDPSLAEFKRPQTAKTGTDSAVRASLVSQSRDYVARHKRPVLLSIAALFVLVGTMALVQRIGLGGQDAQMADAAPPAPISRAVDATPSPRPTRQSAALTPSALPRSTPTLAAQIPGSDPIQTGSIPSLPAFAARGPSAGAPAQPPVLPAGLQKMASVGDSSAEYVLGTQYAEGRLVARDFKAAAGWYQKAADQGVVPAQYRLASLYEKGLGVVQDKAKAKALYLRAAGAGNPRAMHNLAVMLADGDGHPDYEGAATWFRKAAQYGVHDSQYNLAILLARGLGTQQSFLQSYQWFAIAAAQNDTDAGKKRDEVATRLNASDLAVAKALAAAFRPRNADVAAVDVQPPPGGWDGADGASPLNSPRPKISML